MLRLPLPDVGAITCGSFCVLTGPWSGRLTYLQMQRFRELAIGAFGNPSPEQLALVRERQRNRSPKLHWTA